MIKWVLIFFVILVLLFILFYNIVNHNEDKILFYPSHKRHWKPKSNYKEVFINVCDSSDIAYCAKDKKENCEYIHGWHFDNFPGKKTICFTHGNSGNISNRGYVVNICKKFKLNLFLFDYRGYGQSSSHPHKVFLREDGELAFNYLHKVCKIPNKDIIIWGESIGCVGSIWTASKYKCGGLILLCSFSSLDDAISYRYKGKGRAVSKFLTGLLSYKMDMLSVKDYLKEVTCPVVIIHSEKDELIPYACSWINYHSIKHANKLHIKIKGGHASPDIKSSQLRQIFEFCDLNYDNISSDVNVSDILHNLKTVAAKYHNFID